MAQPTSDWLLEPIIPAAPALPRSSGEEASAPSGTWRVGTRVHEQANADDARFATSDAEAPTVRPGSLRPLKRR